eukprot:1194745-Prorocentrum_minimum.AAC.5
MGPGWGQLGGEKGCEKDGQEVLQHSRLGFVLVFSAKRPSKGNPICLMKHSRRVQSLVLVGRALDDLAHLSELAHSLSESELVRSPHYICRSFM